MPPPGTAAINTALPNTRRQPKRKKKNKQGSIDRIGVSFLLVLLRDATEELKVSADSPEHRAVKKQNKLTVHARWHICAHYICLQTSDVTKRHFLSPTHTHTSSIQTHTSQTRHSQFACCFSRVREKMHGLSERWPPTRTDPFNLVPD